jgi:hypothetical protein
MILLNGDQTGMVAENQRVRFQHHVFLVKKCFKMSNTLIPSWPLPFCRDLQSPFSNEKVILT